MTKKKLNNIKKVESFGSKICNNCLEKLLYNHTLVNNFILYQTLFFSLLNHRIEPPLYLLVKYGGGSCSKRRDSCCCCCNAIIETSVVLVQNDSTLMC